MTSPRTPIGRINHIDEWFFRIHEGGWGIGLRNHRRHPPLFSERYADIFKNGNRYYHFGRWCVVVWPAATPTEESAAPTQESAPEEATDGIH